MSVRERLGRLASTLSDAYPTAVREADVAVDEAGRSRWFWLIYFGTRFYRLDGWAREQICALMGHDHMDVSLASPDFGTVTVMCVRCGAILADEILH